MIKRIEIDRRLLLTLIFAIPLMAIFSQCLTATSKPDPRGELYAGSTTCVTCHKNVYSNYLHTAHFLSTRPAAAATMYGDFSSNNNTFYFDNDLKVVMEKHQNGLYQTAYKNNKVVESQPFDITFGGTKAETYLYWKGNKMFELPISYFKNLHSWTNSPGLDVNHPDYSREIGRRCFECHASYIKELPMQTQGLLATPEFDKNSLIFGIDCERCHGPGTNHVNFHTTYPEAKKPMYIKTFASLTRAQKIDVCATCHSGNTEHMQKSIFAFQPGDKLADYKEGSYLHQNIDSAKLDVHGNQTQLLESSKCFAMTNMNCTTCHDVHKNDRQNVAMYSQKCLTCHTGQGHTVCKLTASVGPIIKNNCIDCHMPAQPSNAIQVQISHGGSAIPYLVRTHHIAVYKKASTTVLDDLKKYNLLQ